ncbi:acidic repeat-containing protein-like [Pyrus ussuriensis x Pyrus communis]|uniref:Acidic repeat-containing protein-like n=1 Tax=Pyrus ussuriensis x Pyrus communis TaxID=2448454 RepID=A0A5N5GYY1_9ROSA|nr:acidic repeat-containing protein-like [Pyrus ussuriensis x Pyrus communis]
MAPTTLIRELNSLKKDFEDGMGMGLVRRGKREHVADRIFEPNSCGSATKKRRKCSTKVEELIPDEDYETFLSSLADHGSDVDYIDNRWVDDRSGGDVNVNDRSVDDGDHNVEVRSLDDGVDGGDDEDPDYKILLDKLTKGGKSFTNNRSVDDGYDDDDDDDDVHANGRYADDGGENIQSLDDSLDDEDPQYKIFLEKLRQDGKSYVLEAVGDNGKSEVIKYEQENEILDGPDFDTPETLKKSQVKEKPDIQSTLRRSMKRKCTNCLKNSVLPVNKEVIASPRIVKYDLRKENRAILENSSMKKKKKNVNEKAANGSTRGRPLKIPPVEAVHFTMQGCANEKAAKGSTKECPVKRTHVADLRFAKQGCKRGLEDEDYTKLLSCLQFDDGKMVYSPPNGRPVILDDDGESSPPNRSFTSFTAVDVDSGRCVKTRDASHSQFRKGLMDILTRPYDYEEYRSLLKEATHRKPLGHDRNLRNRTITCPVEGKLAPSYLKQHIVLRRKITAARGDRPRVLNLLRGFFYWLKNVAQDESFCPWNDSSCLKVLPPSDKKAGLTERGLEGKRK